MWPTNKPDCQESASLRRLNNGGGMVVAGKGLAWLVGLDFHACFTVQKVLDRRFCRSCGKESKISARQSIV